MNTDGARIAALNDIFRASGFQFFITRGVRELEYVDGLVALVRRFHSFTPDNDPYGEHDFGTIMWLGTKVFWKIDYYDAALKYGSDPLDRHCQRVLTIMLASEY